VVRQREHSILEVHNSLIGVVEPCEVVPSGGAICALRAWG
jgi:hypothetical protein